MYTRILLATDGSDTSERALAEAIGIAKFANGNLRIVHVIDAARYLGPASIGITRSVVNSVFRQRQDMLDQAAQAATDAGVAAATRLLEGETSRIAQIISDEADAWPADLIVAGTHGRRGPSRLVLGSVAENIARIANKPLLLIRAS